MFSVLPQAIDHFALVDVGNDRFSLAKLHKQPACLCQNRFYCEPVALHAQPLDLWQPTARLQPVGWAGSAHLRTRGGQRGPAWSYVEHFVRSRSEVTSIAERLEVTSPT